MKSSRLIGVPQKDHFGQSARSAMASALDRRSIKDLLYCVEGLGHFEGSGTDPNEQKYVKGVDCIGTQFFQQF